MKTLRIAAIAVAVAALGGTHAVARPEQDPQTPQQLFEAGEYDRAIATLRQQHEGGMGPAERYLASLILVRTSPPNDDAARQELDAIAAAGDEGWTHVAASARALIDGNTPAALDEATKAVAAAPDLFAAQYQLGLAKAKAEDWTAAADAFERASQIEPGFAYAHYYAGLSYSRLRRTDREAQHFEMFVRLAPKAPERLAVESILRTLRGR